MALIKCKECGREISDKAKTCIGCGATLNQGFGCSGWVWIAIILFFGFFAFLSIFGM